MNNHIIYAQSLYDLVVLKKRVDPFELLDTAKSIYISVKAVGITNTTIKYYTADNKKDEVLEKGVNIPLEMRAFAAFVARLYYRWHDDSMRRLEKHYEIPTTIGDILSTTKLFKNSSSCKNLACITIADAIDLYLSK